MQYLKPPASADLGDEMTVAQFACIIDECVDQPPWRAEADREADYADGNQLDTDLLRRLKAAGIPPAKENIIGPKLAAIRGYEEKTRTDWRITPDGDPEGQDVADALNYRVNQAERYSKADIAMGKAFGPQASVGLGWVEVSRNSDPMEYKTRCRYVHRNEIFWDMRAKEDLLEDASWLLREKFTKKDRAIAAFPAAREIIEKADPSSGLGGYGGYIVEGGNSTGLIATMRANRAWTSREQAWYRKESDEVCIVELWYRRWVNTVVLKMRGGRVVEFDIMNPVHQAAVASRTGFLEKATVARVRRSYWMGPHRLFDGPTPYPHPHFPYVPFWGYREDMTGIPFGLVRDMLWPQDNLNSTQAKLRWGLSSVRTERTEGVVAMTDEQFRRQIARPDADIILSQKEMAKEGARFEVHRDFPLNDQHFQMQNDARQAVERVGPITSAFQGQTGTARSGVQEQTQVEQSEVGIADLMGNFKESRTRVGEILLAIEIEDLGKEEETIVIEGDTLNPPRKVVLNKPEIDPDTGLLYLSNDVMRTRMKVSLEDVPSSSSFRAQQLSSLSEATKSLPPEMQQVVMPFMIDLMDLPRKKDMVEALRMAQAGAGADPEAIKEQVKHELMYDLELRKVAIQERTGNAQVEKLIRDAIQVAVTTTFTSMQAAGQLAMNPAIAPIADKVLQDAGYQPATPAGVDPNYDQLNLAAPVTGAAMADTAGAAEQAQAMGAPQDDSIPGAAQNTSPAFPPVPQGAATGMAGIETPTPADNLNPA